MKNTRETDYAIRCVYSMSKEPDRLHMIREIAADQNVPKSFLAKILQKLVKAKIVSSARGVKGGFALAQRPSEITLLDVIEAVQGPLFINSCVLDSKSCSRKGMCSIHPIWVEIVDSLACKLRGYNFKDILNKSIMASANKTLTQAKHGRRKLRGPDLIITAAHLKPKKRLAAQI
ncbi:MAG: Rrf2 family transcriptional regulator [Nitrospirae bacterium]|nr:Rrf2 family transcriptional regulator [Nitrospirota bacterium]